MTEPSAQTTPPTNEVWAVFCGGIDQGSVQRIMANLAFATQNQVTGAHLLFQSTGGTVGDGVCLYNFFKTYPIDLTVYNVGSVQSIAAVAYLGAKRRVASALATFMLHKSTMTLTASATSMKASADALVLEDQRTEAILKPTLKLTDEQWRQHAICDLWMSTEQAIACGLAQEVREFAPPLGSQIYSI
jgi:ATP-dependent Clp protease, protease subunit